MPPTPPYAPLGCPAGWGGFWGSGAGVSIRRNPKPKDNRKEMCTFLLFSEKKKLYCIHPFDLFFYQRLFLKLRSSWLANCSERAFKERNKAEKSKYNHNLKYFEEPT